MSKKYKEAKHWATNRDKKLNVTSIVILGKWSSNELKFTNLVVLMILLVIRLIFFKSFRYLWIQFLFSTKSQPVEKYWLRLKLSLSIAYINFCPLLITWLQIDANVLHDWNVKLVENAHDDSFTSGWTDCVIVGLGIDQ